MSARDYPPGGNDPINEQEAAAERKAVALAFAQEQLSAIVAEISGSDSAAAAHQAFRHVSMKEVPGFDVIKKNKGEKLEMESAIGAANEIIDEALEKRLEGLSASLAVHAEPAETVGTKEPAPVALERSVILSNLLDRSGFMNDLTFRGTVGNDRDEIVRALRGQYIGFLERVDGSESWTPEQVSHFLAEEEEKNPTEITPETEPSAPEGNLRIAKQAVSVPAEKPIFKSEEPLITNDIRKGFAKVRKTIDVAEKNKKLPMEDIERLRRSLSEKENRAEALLKSMPEDGSISQELADILADIPDVSTERPETNPVREMPDISAADGKKERAIRPALTEKASASVPPADTTGNGNEPTLTETSTSGGRFRQFLDPKQATSVAEQIAEDARSANNGVPLSVFPPGRGPMREPAPDAGVDVERVIPAAEDGFVNPYRLSQKNRAAFEGAIAKDQASQKDGEPVDIYGPGEGPIDDSVPVIAIGVDHTPDKEISEIDSGVSPSVDSLVQPWNIDGLPHVDPSGVVNHSETSVVESQTVERKQSQEEGEVEALKMRVGSLREAAKEKGTEVAVLEDALRREREQFDVESKRIDEQYSRYQTMKRTLGRWFGGDLEVSKKLEEEHNQLKAHLTELEEKVGTARQDRDRLRAEFVEASQELDTRTGGTAFSDAATRETVAAAYGVSPDGLEVVDGEGNQNEETVSADTAEQGVNEVVLRKFESVGIDRMMLLETTGFDTLKYERQLLAYRNYNQLLFSTIEERGRADAEADIARSPWYRRIGKSMVKDFLVGRKEKDLSVKYSGQSKEGDGFYEEKLALLQSIVAGVARGPECSVDKYGNLEMRYASGDGFADLSDAERSVVDDFNDRSGAFAKIPHEWRYESTAKPADQKRFSEASVPYEEGRDRLLTMLEGKYGKERAMELVSDIDGKVRMTQFFSSNPDVENALTSIDEKNLFWKATLNTLTERGGYLALGLVSRSVGGIMLGSMASGFISGWYRANEELKKKEKSHRKSGAEKRVAEAKKFSRAEHLSEKLGLLSDAVEQLGANMSSEDRAKTQTLLEARIVFTREKLDKGLVNFGNDSTRGQFDLVQSLARAEAVAAMYSKHNEALAKRMEKLLAVSAKKIDTDVSIIRQDFKMARAFQGMVIAGAFAGTGSLIREYVLGIEQPLSDTNPKLSAQTAVEVAPPTTEPVVSDAGGPVEAPASKGAQPVPAESEPTTPTKSDGSSDGWRTMTEADLKGRASLTGAEAPSSGATPAGAVPSPEKLSIAPGSGKSIESTLIGHLKSQGMDSAEAGRQAHAMVLDYTHASGGKVSIDDLSTINRADIDVIADAKGNLSIRSIDFDSAGSSGSAVRDQAIAQMDRADRAALASGSEPETVVPARTAASVADGQRVGGSGSLVQETPAPRSVEPLSPELQREVAGAAKSAVAQEYLLQHPERISSFRSLIAGYGKSVLEPAAGSVSGVRGVADLGALNPRVDANQVMRDSLQFILKPDQPVIAPTLRLPNTLNPEQILNMGKFMMKATEDSMFGKEGVPLRGESLSGYFERIAVLSAKTGKMVRLDGGEDLLRAFARTRI